MYTITRRYEFSAAHRIEGHPKCGRLHGHNYAMEVSVSSPVLANGMVMDFADLDEHVKVAVLDVVDHRYIVANVNAINHDPYYEHANADDVARLPLDHSTAEELAGHFAECIDDILPRSVRVTKLELWETLRSKAVWYA